MWLCQRKNNTNAERVFPVAEGHAQSVCLERDMPVPPSQQGACRFRPVSRGHAHSARSAAGDMPIAWIRGGTLRVYVHWQTPGAGMSGGGAGQPGCGAAGRGSPDAGRGIARDCRAGGWACPFGGSGVGHVRVRGCGGRSKGVRRLQVKQLLVKNGRRARPLRSGPASGSLLRRDAGAHRCAGECARIRCRRRGFRCG